MVENTHGSPLRRSPGRRGRSNNDDSRAEREFFIQTDKDLASLKDGFRSMVEDFGIMYKPEKKDHSNYKAVHIGNLPEDIDYHKLLAKVRGGKIVSATICNTIKIRGCGRRMSALVVFVNAESARAYVQFSNKNGIYFDSQKAVVGLVDTPTYPLSLPAERRIGHGQNRCLMIKKLRSELSLARIDRVINVGVNKYRVDAMERLWKDEKGDVRIRFASISAASMAYWRLRTDPNYDRLEIIFEDDPCRRPLSDLLPPLKGRRVSDFAEMKVNYDDKDDSGVENTQEISPLNQPIRSKVNNADEIELEDDEEDTVDHKFTEGKTDTKKRVSDKAKTADGANNANDSNTSEAMAAEMATIANGEGIQVEDSQKIQEPRIPNISKTEPPTSTKDIPRPEDFPKVEDSHTAEDFTLLESVTFSPIPHLSSSVSDESSSITTVILTAADGGVESWADVVNEAVEAGGLEPPVELNPVLTPTTLIDTDGEPLNQVIRFLPSIIEEDLLTCEPVEEPVTEAVMETLVAGFPITELPVTKALVVEALVRETSVKQSSTTTAPMKQSSAKTSPVEAFRKPAVKLPSSTHTMIPDKFDLAGTDLDPVLLPRYVFEKVLSNSPRKGLSSSRWAHPATNATAPIIIEAPLAVPVLGTAAKSTSEPIATTGPLAKPVPQPASLVPANAPKGPRAGVPTSRWVNPESSHKSLVRDQLARIQKSLPAQAAAEPNAIEPSTALAPKPTSTGPKFMSCKRQNSASSSRYSSLDLDTSCPRSSLRNFYSAVDLQTAAPEKLGVAVFEAAVSGAADLGPVTPDTAKSVPTTPEAGQHARPRGKTGPESGVETKSGIETKPRVEIQSGVETQSGIMVTT
jgi:hypothetical protein